MDFFFFFFFWVEDTISSGASATSIYVGELRPDCVRGVDSFETVVVVVAWSVSGDDGTSSTGLRGTAMTLLNPGKTEDGSKKKEISQRSSNVQDRMVSSAKKFGVPTIPQVTLSGH